MYADCNLLFKWNLMTLATTFIHVVWHFTLFSSNFSHPWGLLLLILSGFKLLSGTIMFISLCYSLLFTMEGSRQFMLVSYYRNLHTSHSHTASSFCKIKKSNAAGFNSCCSLKREREKFIKQIARLSWLWSEI